MIKKRAERISDKTIAFLVTERKRQGISHEKLAEMIGMHRSAISLIESKKRRPTLFVCIKIALALNLNLSRILEEAEL